MKAKLILSLLLTLAWALALSAPAATWHVAAAGSDETGDGSTNAPWASITNALAWATTNDTISVAGGVYTQNVVFTADKDGITIQGGYNPTTWAWDPAANRSVVQSTNGSSVVYLAYGANSNALNYLTLCGGTGANKGGVELQNSSGQNLYLFLNGCSITGNYYGVYCQSLTWYITARNCLIARNTNRGFAGQYSGGACYLYNCTIADNGSDGFQSNTAMGYPGVVPYAKNTIFSGNNGYGVSLPNGTAYQAFENCLFFSNTNGHYRGCCGDAGSNKTGRDALYVDHVNGDYRLQDASPATAAGKDLSAMGVTMDILGAGRPQGGAWDIGCYEGSGAGEGALASSIHVAPDGADDPARDGSENAPFATPGFALGYAAPGGTVRVAGGSYTSTISFGPDKDGTVVRGGYDPATWVWDPSNQVSRVKAAGASVVQVGNDCNNAGVGYLTLYGASYGVYPGCPGETFYVDGCTITGNTYAVFTELNSFVVTLRNCLLARNSGSAIYANYSSGTFNLYNCTVANNAGNGVYTASAGDPGSTINSKNSIYSGNGGWGLYRGSGGSSLIDYNLFYGNAAGAYSGSYTDGGNNKLGKEPKYVELTNDNYRLQNSSPAAAAGTDLIGVGVTADIVGVARPQGAAWDMGAYEGAGAGEPPPVSVAYVSKNGSDVTGTGSRTSAWATINYALSMLSANGQLYVASGVYTENVQLASGSMTIRGGYDAGNWSWDPVSNQTVIAGNGNPPLALLPAASTHTLSFLTLTGGTGANKAGILLGAGAAPVIESCMIVSNAYGVYGDSLNPPPNPTFRNCILARNASSGVYLPWTSGAGLARFYNCTLADNGGHGFQSYAAGTDGGVSFVGKNTLVTGNGGWGVARGTSIQSASVQNCLFYGNTNGTTTGGLADLGNNKSGRDPLYVDAGANDYRVALNSPAAAAGMNLFPYGVTNDIVGVARPQPVGGRWDMGAYEGAGGGEPPLKTRAYVSTLGSDTAGDGSATNPWATVSFALGWIAPSVLSQK